MIFDLAMLALGIVVICVVVALVTQPEPEDQYWTTVIEASEELPCDPTFYAIVVEEWKRMPLDIFKHMDLRVWALDEIEPGMKGVVSDESYGYFYGVPGLYGKIIVCRGPIERAAPQTKIDTREHVYRVLKHELAHASGMRHEDLAPYGI